MWRAREGRDQKEWSDVLAFEQPSAAQKFSAQEFLKADCSVWKKTKQACRPRGLLESKHIQRRAIKLSRSEKEYELRLTNASIMRQYWE
jgi:hypothetical protein